MKRQVLLVGIAASCAALAQSPNFAWDYSGSPQAGLSGSNWVLNGDPTYVSSTGGSAIWGATVSGANPNDYEVYTKMYLPSAGGTYMHFLRANPTLVLPGQGSYISVELA